MDERDASQDTQVDPPPPVSEFTELAQLAFASRHLATEQSLAARNLVYLSPDALDMDLSDPMQRDFGDYELLEKIGQGGMGVVYRARQRSLDREVALKLLIAGPWAPQRFIERFQLEAQSAARLEHPNIVTVYEGGSQQDLHYFSMRLVRGESLSAILRRRGKLDAREAAKLLLTIAEAVDYAHRLGVLHLDLKPGNVLVDANGEPLVADFGLARRLDQALADPAGDASGTPSYMAPEQADSKKHAISVATDIYGLGGILYEMLCTQPPFTAPTAHATLKRVLSDKVEAPRAYDATIPRDLEAVCLKCLSKHPADRYQSAGELIADLRAFLDDRPVSVRRPPSVERVRRWVRREPRFAAAVAGVAGALVLGLAATTQQWQRAEANAFANRELIWEGRREAALGLEEDGRGLEAWQLLLTNLIEQEAAGERERAELEQLRIGLLRSQGARLIDSTAILDGNPIATAISPDSGRVALAFANDLTLRWYDAESLEEQGRVELEPILAPNGRDAPWRTSDQEYHPPQLLRFIDNDRLLVTLRWLPNRANPSQADTWLVDLANATIVEPPHGSIVAAYSGNGDWALLADREGRIDLWQVTPSWSQVATLADVAPRTQSWLLADDGRVAFSLGIGMRSLTKHRLRDGTPAEPIALPGDGGISAWTLSGDGRSLALGDFDGNVLLLDVATLALRRLPLPRGREITWLAFSEDDAWLATAEFYGQVQVIDVTAGDVLVGVGMRAEFTVTRVAVSRRWRLVVGAGQGETAAWRIPVPSVRMRPAHRIGTMPVSHEAAGIYPVGWSLETGLLASAGLADRQLHLWRLPLPPTLEMEVSRQVADEPREDHERVVDVAWNHVRLVSPEGRALTEWLALDQPAGYTQLLDEGRVLLVTVGATLQTFDTNRLTPRYAPVPLPAVPQRLLASPDGRFVLLSFGGSSGFGHEEQLRAFNAVTGRWLPGDTVLDGPVQRYVFSPDRQRIAALGPADGVTTLLARDGLEVVNYRTHYLAEPVKSIDFMPDGRLLLLTPADPNNDIQASLVAWDPESDEEVRLEVGGGMPLTIAATPDGYAVLGREYDSLFDANGDGRRLPRRAAVPVVTPPMKALSPDGRILAVGRRFGAQLYDVASGEAVGLPLDVDFATLDHLVDLSFVQETSELRGRSLLGYPARWPLPRETASIATQQHELERLLPDRPDDAPIIFAATDAERRRLRAADPGPWPPEDMRPSRPLAAGARPGLPIPAREPATPPRLVDLTAVYNRADQSIPNTFGGGLLNEISRYPIGVLHLGDTDFDVRGVVQIGLIEPGESEALQRLECLPMPMIRAAAVHLLVNNGWERPSAVGEPLAQLTLRYEDESEAVIPLRAGIELQGADDDADVPFVFATDQALLQTSGPLPTLAAPRVENPHPERIIRCVDLYWPAVTGSTLELFAMTLEPVEPAPL